MSVEERRKAIDARRIFPSLNDMRENFEIRRENGSLPKLDLSQSFVDAVRGQHEVLAEAHSDEERAEAKFLIGHLRRCAKQNLSKEQFARIEKELK